MKIFIFSILIFIFQTGSTVVLAGQTGQEIPTNLQQMEENEHEVLPYVALGSSILGLALIAVPYLSILGLALCLGGLFLGVFSRKKAKKRWLSNLAIIGGSLGFAYFLGVVGLILFF